MKISKVETISLMAEPKVPLRMPNAIISRFYTTIVRISTDDGITGIGECIVRLSPKTTQTIVEELLTPIVIGRDPLDVEGIWWDMFKTMRGRGHSRGFMLEAISGVDMAIWDILGRYHKLPIGKLLGGYGRKKVNAYASSIMLNDISVMEKEAEELLKQGFKAIKVKVGLGVSKDIKIVKAIRNVVGDDIELMVDANSFYDSGSAVLAGKKFEELGVIWFEEPVPPDDIQGYEKISKKLNIQIAAGESEFSVYGIRELLERDCIDIVQPDVSRAGGFTECRKIANLAGAFNKAYAPHTGFSSSICLFASMQLAAYATNFSSYEYMYIDNPLQHILNIPTPKAVDGVIEIPEGYGLGAELDESAVKKYRLR